MTRFRPCIDLHAGRVKQIVGGSLSDTSPSSLRTNYVSSHAPSYYAQLYRDAGMRGAHVIMLGPGNEDATREALAVWKGGLQVGGGVNEGNCREWVGWGAEKVIITSYLFPSSKFSLPRLQAILAALDHDTSKLVIDLSCRRVDQKWVVAMDKWQRLTDMEINQDTIKMLEPYCSEFLVHAADNEGLQKGIDEDLVQKLGEWCSLPVTYAGGGRNLADLQRVKELSGGKADLTIGSALDIFGGSGITWDDCVKWNKEQDEPA